MPVAAGAGCVLLASGFAILFRAVVIGPSDRSGARVGSSQWGQTRAMRGESSELGGERKQRIRMNR